MLLLSLFEKFEALTFKQELEKKVDDQDKKSYPEKAN
jgi:hypothetical protein